LSAIKVLYVDETACGQFSGTSSDLQPRHHPENTMAKEQRWILNQATGNHVRTGITDPVIVLDLWLNQVEGPTVPVGKFQVNLVVQAARGTVTRRQLGGESVYDVKVFAEPDGTYVLGVRRSCLVPLENFRVS
jgi:hypothetical protein